MEINGIKTAEPKNASHSFSVTDRKKATMTGIVKVDSSDSQELVLTSALGKLEIKGSELKITRFDEASGDLAFTGKIDGIKYVQAKQPLVKRIFK